MISALNERGLDNLLAQIQISLPLTRKKTELLIPYSDGGLVNYIREDCVLLEEDYRGDGIYIKAIVDIRFLEKHKDYIIG